MTLPDNMKFRVGSPEESEMIQKALFELGYEWWQLPRCKKVQFTEAAFLYAKKLGDELLIVYGSNFPEFEKDSGQLYKLEMVPTIVPVKQEQPTLTINGLSYLVSDIEKALSSIHPVNTQSK